MVVVKVEEGKADGGGAVDGFQFRKLAFRFFPAAEEFFAIAPFVGDVAEEEDDPVI